MIVTKSPRVLLSFLMTAGCFFTPVVASAVTPFEDRDELKTAVDQYCGGSFDSSSSAYGPIEDWDVSKVTSMYEMFSLKTTCNPDISKWNTSSASDFYSMFRGATSFNQDLSTWDVSRADDFDNMFDGATSFNQPFLYCNWQSKSSIFKTSNNVCSGTVTCGWGNDTCVDDTTNKSPKSPKSPKSFADTTKSSKSTKSVDDTTKSSKSADDTTKSAKSPKAPKSTDATKSSKATKSLTTAPEMVPEPGDSPPTDLSSSSASMLSVTLSGSLLFFATFLSLL